MNRSNLSIALLALLVIAMPVPAAAQSAGGSASIPVYGKADAPVTFTVWGSLTCPYTRLLMPVLMQVVDQSNGKANIEWRHFPDTKPDPVLHIAAMADPAKFWDYASAALTRAGVKFPDADKMPFEIGREVGVPEAKIRAALADEAMWEAVKQDFLAAKLAGIRMTPGLFFDGYYLTPSGATRNTTELKRILSDLVKNAKI